LRFTCRKIELDDYKFLSIEKLKITDWNVRVRIDETILTRFLIQYL